MEIKSILEQLKYSFDRESEKSAPPPVDTRIGDDTPRAALITDALAHIQSEFRVNEPTCGSF